MSIRKTQNRKQPTPKRAGFLSEASGTKSSRRLIAFLNTIVSILFIFGVCHLIYVGRDLDWKVVLVLLGVPSIITLLCLFFTTWEDVAKVIQLKSKGNKDNDNNTGGPYGPPPPY